MYSRTRKKMLSEINVIPYIDIMLVLLIIVMITSPLFSQGILVELPRVSSAPLESTNKKPVIINIDKAGLFYINYGDEQDQPVNQQTLVNRVRALLSHQPELPVLIGGDSQTPYGNIATVMALLQDAGVPSVGMITERPVGKKL